MSKKYNVPVVAQTSQNTCWHASSLMIWYYWQGVTSRQGPMNTLSGSYSNDKGVTPQQFITLAEKVGLKKVDQQYINYSSAIIEGLLTKHGPLWCAGYWFGPGHIIVLTGIDGEDIYFNDPGGGVRKTNKMNWFNAKIAKAVPGCIMYKNPGAY